MPGVDRSKEHELFNYWMSLTPSQRIEKNLPPSITKWASSHGIHQQTASNWARSYRDGGYKQHTNPEEYLAANTVNVNSALISACNKGNAAALNTYYKLTGKLDADKVEQKFELSIAEKQQLATEFLEALRRNHAELGGLCPVCGKSEAFCLETRMGTEPEHTETREVDSVAVPA